MSANLDELLKSKIINGWNLFWLIAAPISLVMVLGMMRTDLSSAKGISSMIELSVRCAVPWLFVAFAASSLQVLFPGSFSRWLLRNRKYIGHCFAAAMAWQLTFILWLVSIHTEYYVQDVYALTDAVEGVIGYTFLIAMVVTSFKFGRSRLTPKQWKLLHKTAIYWLWFYAWSTYWFHLFYYQSPAVLLDYFYYWGGLLAWGLRVTAWNKKSWKQADTGGARRISIMLPGIAAVAIGLTGSSFGAAWSPQVYEFYSGIQLVEFIDSFMPYFPLVPFYPLLIMMSGAFLMVKSRG